MYHRDRKCSIGETCILAERFLLCVCKLYGVSLLFCVLFEKPIIASTVLVRAGEIETLDSDKFLIESILRGVDRRNCREDI